MSTGAGSVATRKTRASVRSSAHGRDPSTPRPVTAVVTRWTGFQPARARGHGRAGPGGPHRDVEAHVPKQPLDGGGQVARLRREDGGLGDGVGAGHGDDRQGRDVARQAHVPRELEVQRCRHRDGHSGHAGERGHRPADLHEAHRVGVDPRTQGAVPNLGAGGEVITPSTVATHLALR
jgi:hypothetical protein